MRKNIEVGEATSKDIQQETILHHGTAHKISRQEAKEQHQRDFKILKEKLEKAIQKQPHNIKNNTSLHLNSANNDSNRRKNNNKTNN